MINLKGQYRQGRQPERQTADWLKNSAPCESSRPSASRQTDRRPAPPPALRTDTLTSGLSGGWVLAGAAGLGRPPAPPPLPSPPPVSLCPHPGPQGRSTAGDISLLHSQAGRPTPGAAFPCDPTAALKTCHSFLHLQASERHPEVTPLGAYY
ncbi:hypothetical protein VULLAG_LOCUS15879 [Vulpes lagopus]